MSHIQELRKSRNMSQIQFGRQFGISQQTVSRIEKEPLTIGTDVLVKIAEYFKVTTDYVLDLSDEKHNQILIEQMKKKVDEHYDFILDVEKLSEENREYYKRMLKVFLEMQKEEKG